MDIQYCNLRASSRSESRLSYFALLSTYHCAIGASKKQVLIWWSFIQVKHLQQVCAIVHSSIFPEHRTDAHSSLLPYYWYISRVPPQPTKGGAGWHKLCLSVSVYHVGQYGRKQVIPKVTYGMRGRTCVICKQSPDKNKTNLIVNQAHKRRAEYDLLLLIVWTPTWTFFLLEILLIKFLGFSTSLTAAWFSFSKTN